MDRVRDLSQRKCVPCSKGTPPLSEQEAAGLLAQLEGWRLEGGHLRKDYRFPDFAQALAYVNRVGKVAEKNGHHPDIQLAWGRVGLELWTHAIGGLSEADFVLAAKCDKAHRKLLAKQAEAEGRVKKGKKPGKAKKG